MLATPLEIRRSHCVNNMDPEAALEAMDGETTSLGQSPQ